MDRELQLVVSEELERVGFDLVELLRRGTKSRPVLDVRIERPDGAPITVDDCSRASRAIEARLDAGDVVSNRYVLEVSSPGVERPLRTATDWRRFVGQRAVVTAPTLPGGKAEVTIAALEGDEELTAVLRDTRGGEHRVPLAAIAGARLAFHWNR